jgi:diacylglycerol O-acyltransferase / wax synthase
MRQRSLEEAMMTNGHQNNSFSFGDALFLYVEREGQPLNIAGVSVFEGEIKLKDCIAFIESKLPLIPRYRQRVVFPAFDLGLPRWEFDCKFDIRNHVRQVRLKHGTEQELKALAGKIVSDRLNRERPLWDFTLARLQGGRMGLVVRIHHCLADGIAGVGVMNVIMDTIPDARPIHRKEQPVEASTRPKDATAVILDGLAKSYLSLVSGALTLQTGLLNMAQEAVANPTGPPAELVRLLSELAAPAERLPFNRVCKGPQKFAWTEVPLPDIKAVKNICGGTVNDVVLTTVTLAFGRYAEQRGVDLKGRSLRIVIPVNVRGNGDATELGNQISFVPVPAPLDIRDPQKLLDVVRERVEILKRARAADFVGLFGGLLSSLPSAFWANAGPIVSQLPLSLCNIICTNVPGPQAPLYLMGHKMLKWYPWVPIGGLMGINCAILTYNGTAFFGFTGDVHAAPDLERLEKFVDHSFAELRAGATAEALAEARPQRKRRARPNAKIPVARTRATRKKSSPPVVASKPTESAPARGRTTEPEKALPVGA